MQPLKTTFMEIIINPHWDKILRNQHQLDDKCLLTIRALLHDTLNSLVEMSRENIELNLLKRKHEKIKDLINSTNANNF